MITPLDIQNKEFAKGVRGYKEEEVDMFLDLITLDLEKIVKENARLKAEVASLEEALEKYKGSEGEVVKVLQQAQRLMGDISISAEKRAEILLKNAELDAELTVREARERAERLKNENQVMERRYVEFRSKYKRMLESELERFEETQEEVFADFNDNKLEELVSAPMAEGRESLSTDSLEKTMFAKVYTDPEEDRKTVVINMKEEAGE